ncbi:MAG: substrate-binding domain-containing protein [Magnetospirillum sp. WYHS-4]
MNRWTAAAAIGILAAAPAGAADRDILRVVGSSSLFPFSSAVAEAFRRGSPFRAPVVESTGTGGGFKIFCAGVGLNTPDIVTASRPILPAEAGACRANGVSALAEVALGHGAVVLAQARGGAAMALTRRHLWLGLARQVPVGGRLAANPHRRWSDVDPTLPDTPIRVYGPPPTSGTRDVFAQVALEGGCSAFRQVRDLPAEKHREACESLREDGAYVEVGEDDEMAIRRVAADKEALAVVEFGAVLRHGNLVRGVPVEGIVPTAESIGLGNYPLARDLYLYVKKDHLGSVPGLGKFVEEFSSPAAIGPEGYLLPLGLVPLAR